MSDEQDFTDLDFVLGAVLAQVEDLTHEDRRLVLVNALAILDGCAPDEANGDET